MRASSAKRGTRSAGALAIMIAAAGLSVMCRGRDPSKGDVRRESSEGGAAGAASGVVPGGGDGATARSSGDSSGDATAMGASGENAASGNPGSGGATSAGETTGAGGSTGQGVGGNAPSSGGNPSGRGGADSGGANAAGMGGACGTKTSCCDPADPPCIDGNLCPSGADYCCDALAGARLPCDPLTELKDVVCINPCTSTSYGTGSCAQCTVDSDPLCSDPTWDDACIAGGYATCSDPVAGYRAECDSNAAGSYRGHVLCTCSPGAACVPTPCCGGGVPSCEPSGCNPTEGSCCSDTGHYEEVCTDYSGTLSDQKFICLNDCTGRSYGTGSCDSCVSGADPLCDRGSSWMNGCNQGSPVYCSDATAGYRLSCIIKKGSNGLKLPQVDIECACDATK